MIAPTAYIICATPRSGSTWLCDLLTASGAGRPESYFRRADLGYWAREWAVPGTPDIADPVFAGAYVETMK